jgi:hypothetical protein
MGSGAMIYTQSSIKIGSGIPKLLWRIHISLILFFKITSLRVFQALLIISFSSNFYKASNLFKMLS